VNAIPIFGMAFSFYLQVCNLRGGAMKRLALLLVGLLGLVIGLLSTGCASHPEITPGAPPPTPVVVAGDSNGEEPAEPAPDLAARFPLPAPEGEEVTQPDSSNCIDCHTAKETLQELAVEPEEEESLSEGEG
jgi:hypothetical protein